MAKSYASAPDMTIDLSKSYSAKIETNLGDIEIDLLAERSPLTVNLTSLTARLSAQRIGNGTGQRHRSVRQGGRRPCRPISPISRSTSTPCPP